MTIEKKTNTELAIRQNIYSLNDKSLRLFACACAKHALHLYTRQPHSDDVLQRVLKVVQRYADGEADWDELFDARKLALSGIWHHSTGKAAWGAARAAWDATARSALTAAKDASWDAAWAIGDAGRAVVDKNWDAGRRHGGQPDKAAWTKAWDAAFDKEREWQLAWLRKELTAIRKGE